MFILKTASNLPCSNGFNSWYRYTEGEKSGEYRQMLVQAVHTCAIKFPDVAGSVVHLLMDFLGDTNSASAFDVANAVCQGRERHGRGMCKLAPSSVGFRTGVRPRFPIPRHWPAGMREHPPRASPTKHTGGVFLNAKGALSAIGECGKRAHVRGETPQNHEPPNSLKGTVVPVSLSPRSTITATRPADSHTRVYAYVRGRCG